MLPASIESAGVHFKFAAPGKPNAGSAHGQAITLPAGKFNRLYLIAAAANGDQKATFRVDDQPLDLTIQEWTGKIGQWDNRSWTTRQQPIPLRPGAPSPPPRPPPTIPTLINFAPKIPPPFTQLLQITPLPT